MYKETFIFNQAVPADWNLPSGLTVPAPYVIVQETPPSRFRRKKGYNGPTACRFNRNYKRMPKDF